MGDSFERCFSDVWALLPQIGISLDAESASEPSRPRSRVRVLVPGHERAGTGLEMPGEMEISKTNPMSLAGADLSCARMQQNDGTNPISSQDIAQKQLALHVPSDNVRNLQ